MYKEDKHAKEKATIGDIIIFTADEANNTMGTLTYVAVEYGQEYLLTIHVDAEYLKDEKTVYPIRIDPTIEVNYEKSGAGAIEDVTINSGSGSSGSSGSMYVGKRSTYGISRTLMKFPTLSLSAVYSANEITSAAVEIRDLLCETTAMTVQCHVFNGNAWSESTANWSNVSPNNYTTLLSSNTVSYANGKSKTTAHRYSFDITAAVKGWKSGTYVKSKGIMFKTTSSVENGSTYLYKTFASYNRASYKPSLLIEYKPYINLTLSVSDKYIKVGKTRTIATTKNPSSLYVIWSSEDTSIATVSSSGTVTGVSQGVTKINARYYNSSDRRYYTKNITVVVYDSNGVETGQGYNIMNSMTGKYMSLETLSEVSGTNVSGRDRGEEASSVWNILEGSDGKYRLMNGYANKINALTASSGDACVSRHTGYSNQQFRIRRVYTDDNKGLYWIMYGDYFITYDLATDNIYLSSVSTSYSYWSLMPVEKEDAVLYTVRIEDNIDTSENDYIYYPTYMGKAGYDTIEDVCNQTATTAFKRMLNADVFLFNGHGADGMIRFHSADGSCLGEIGVNRDAVEAGAMIRNVTVSDEICSIESLDNNELAGLRCVLYLGCYTGLDVCVEGEDTTYNLLEETFKKGAHFVLGTTDEIYTYDSNPFLREFMRSISAGESIEQAINSALGYVTDRKTFPIIYIGDTKQILAN